MGLAFLVVGIVLAFAIHESYLEEMTLDKWDPLTPSTLDPQNVTGWVYMVLTSDGIFLKLNVSASDTVRLRIGNYTPNEATGGGWGNLTFDQVGTRFTQKVAIAGTDSDFLEIKNEGTTRVNISGNVEKVGNVYQTAYPYLSPGTLMVLVGLISLVYGTLTKPKNRHSRSKAGKTRVTHYFPDLSMPCNVFDKGRGCALFARAQELNHLYTLVHLLGKVKLPENRVRLPCLEDEQKLK